LEGATQFHLGVVVAPGADEDQFLRSTGHI
jgi:hypothetical protein